jgi:DNA-binding response OmpR family regulator
VQSVLVLADDEALGEAVAQALRSRGFSALPFRTAHGAFLAAAPRPPDAWIIDAALSAMSGREIVHLLRTSSRPELSRARLVGLCGDPDTRAGFVEAGADAVLAKPLEAEALVAALDGARAAQASTGR